MQTPVELLEIAFITNGTLSKTDFDNAKKREEELISKAFYDGYYKEELYDARKYFNQKFKSEQ